MPIIGRKVLDEKENDKTQNQNLIIIIGKRNFDCFFSGREINYMKGDRQIVQKVIHY